MLNEPRDQLEFGLTLRAPELVVIMCRRVKVRIKARKRLKFPAAKKTYESCSVERRFSGDVGVHSRRWSDRTGDPLDRDVGHNFHCMNGSGDLVAIYFMAARLDM